MTVTKKEAKMELVGRFFPDAPQSYFLFGPRGTGKSTWLQNRYHEALYIDLLKPDVFREFSARPERLSYLIEGQSWTTVIVDEVQKVPQILSVVHQLIQKGKGLKFILTGSSARKLKRTGVDLLGGRAVLKTMHPFMAGELGSEFSLNRALSEGMLPVVYRAEDPADVLRTYASLYLREEVQMEGLTRNVGNFARFLESVSFSHGSVLNTSEISRECQVSRKTVEGYIEILEDLLLAFRLPVFSKRAKRHIVQHPKFYYFDAGVFRSLRPSGYLDVPEEIDGAALEGLVAQHLRAFCAYDNSGYQMYFWRTKSGAEVDFVFYGPEGIIAFEVKRTAKIRNSDLTGLKAFKEDYPDARLFLIYGGKEYLKIGDVHYVPCADWLLKLKPGFSFTKEGKCLKKLKKIL